MALVVAAGNLRLAHIRSFSVPRLLALKQEHQILTATDQASLRMRLDFQSLLYFVGTEERVLSVLQEARALVSLTNLITRARWFASPSGSPRGFRDLRTPAAAEKCYASSVYFIKVGCRRCPDT